MGNRKINIETENELKKLVKDILLRWRYRWAKIKKIINEDFSHMPKLLIFLNSLYDEWYLIWYSDENKTTFNIATCISVTAPEDQDVKYVSFDATDALENEDKLIKLFEDIINNNFLDKNI